MKKTTTKPTPQLTNFEQNVLLPILIRGLKTKTGKENAVTRNQIICGLRNNGLAISLALLQKLINYIKINDLVKGLMASPTGYYIANTEQELVGYEQNLLQRELTIKDVRMSVKRQRTALYSELKLIEVPLF